MIRPIKPPININFDIWNRIHVDVDSIIIINVREANMIRTLKSNIFEELFK